MKKNPFKILYYCIWAACFSFPPLFAQTPDVIIEPGFGFPGETVHLVFRVFNLSIYNARVSVDMGEDLQQLGELEIVGQSAFRGTFRIAGATKPGARKVAIILNQIQVTSQFEIMAQGQQAQVRLEVLPVETLFFSDFDPGRIAEMPLIFTASFYNDQQPRTVILEMEIAGQSAGPIIRAQKWLKEIGPGTAWHVSNRDFDTYLTGVAGDKVLSIARQTGTFPADIYQYTLSVYDQNGQLLGRDVSGNEITNPGYTLTLIQPGNLFSESPQRISLKYPVFTWHSDAAVFEIAIYEVRPDQVGAADIVQNRPVFRQEALRQTLFTYPIYAEELKINQTYAWQVKAKVQTSRGAEMVESEVFWFRIDAQNQQNAIQAELRVTGIEIVPSEIRIQGGRQFQFKATGLDENLLPVEIQPQWQVIPANMGTINEKGIFTATDTTGVAAVSAKFGKVLNYATVYVKSREAVTPVELPLLSISYPHNGQEVLESHPIIKWGLEESSAQGLELIAESEFEFIIELIHLSKSGPKLLWIKRLNNQWEIQYPLNQPALVYGERYQVKVRMKSPHFSKREFSTQFSRAFPGKIDEEVINAWFSAKKENRENERVTLIVILNKDYLNTSERLYLRAVSAKIQLQEGNWLQISIPYSRLNYLLKLDFLKSVVLPAPHVLECFSNDFLPKNQKEKNISFKKERLPIAIFDFGFDSTGLKPAACPVRFYSFRQDKRIQGESASEAAHGNSCTLTFLKDLDSHPFELNLINFNTELEFFQALRFAVDTLSVRVISCSVSWMQAYDNYDGRSRLWQRVETILKDQAILVVAAGNFAQSHWEGQFTDQNRDGSHEFASQNQLLKIQLKWGVAYSFLLSWDEWETPVNDLDIRILSARRTPVKGLDGNVMSSENHQGNGQAERPVERITRFSPFEPGENWYYVDIFLKEKQLIQKAPHFELYIYPPPLKTFPEPQDFSSLASGLATVFSDGVLTIAAAGLPQSSQGPTNDGRIRPDFAANGTIRVGAAQLAGTSYAVPQIAAALALIHANHPAWTANQVIDFLQKNCFRYNSDKGKNPVHGWGKVELQELTEKLNQ